MVCLPFNTNIIHSFLTTKYFWLKKGIHLKYNFYFEKLFIIRLIEFWQKFWGKLNWVVIYYLFQLEKCQTILKICADFVFWHPFHSFSPVFVAALQPTFTSNVYQNGLSAVIPTSVPYVCINLRVCCLISVEAFLKPFPLLRYFNGKGGKEFLLVDSSHKWGLVYNLLHLWLLFYNVHIVPCYFWLRHIRRPHWRPLSVGAIDSGHHFRVDIRRHYIRRLFPYLPVVPQLADN